MRAKLVRESLADSQHPKVVIAMQRYKNFKDRMMEHIVKPGIYNVEESDGGGMRNYHIASIKVTEEMNLWDLSMQVAEKLGYVSPWPYLSIYQFNKWELEDLANNKKIIDAVFPDKQLSIQF